MYKRSIRIPTIPTLLFLLLLCGFVVAISNQTDLNFIGRAKSQKEFEPQSVTVSNIKQTGFTVFWQTQKPSIGYITTTSDSSKTPQNAYDIRDTDSIPKQYLLHYVVLDGFEQNEKVSYSIHSSSGTYNQSDIILNVLPGPYPNITPIYGSLVVNGTNLSKNAIVYAKLPDSSIVSIFLANQKSWILPIASALVATEQINYYCTITPCSDATPVNISVLADEGTLQTNTVLANARPMDAPLNIGLGEIPAVTASPTQITNVYGIQTDNTVQNQITASSSSVKKSTITPTSPSRRIMNEPSLLNPSNNALLTFPKPLIRGLGIPNETVTITLTGAIVQVGETTVSKNGDWMWTPLYALEPGVQKVTVKTKNSKNNSIVLTRSFTILPSGQQVLAQSTPSGTLTPTNPISTISPTLSIPTVTPSPVLFPTVTPSPTLPTSASSFPTFLLGGSGIILLGIALTLILL